MRFFCTPTEPFASQIQRELPITQYISDTTRPAVFCVFPTSLTLEISQIIVYYRQRWQIETAFRDAKQHFGFDSYQVKSRKSINQFVQLSFVAASVTKLIFATTESGSGHGISVETVCKRLGIHWYQPAKLTQGLRVAYLRLQLMMNLFSASLKESANSQKITPSLEQDTPDRCQLKNIIAGLSLVGWLCKPDFVRLKMENRG